MQKGDNNKQSSESSVKVLIRVRPLISIQIETRNIVSIGADEQSVVIYIDEYNQIQTKFDKIISQQKNQREVFSNIEPYINKLLDAYNMTIFAYGQTGSGKTYTMFGKDWQNNFAELQKIKKNSKQNTPLTDVAIDDNYAGLIPRSTYHLFNSLSASPGTYNTYCSFLQIYNEKVYDLLQDSPVPSPLNVHQSKFEGIFVEGLGQFKVTDYTDCLELMRRGEKNRFIRQTSMNAKSSRSHTIFQILIQSARQNANGVFTRTRLNLCDLAGSEKINKTEAMNKDHLDQLKNINLSLTTLGKVINSLSKSGNKSLAFFRQSKLTRLLQESLVGNTNTFIIGAISPSSKNKQETLNTLKFVERARHIKLSIKPSSISNQSGQLVSRLQQEMQQLRKLLIQKEKTTVPKQIEQKLKKLQQQNKNLKNITSNKDQDIYKLIDENRRIKDALVRMQKVAMDQLSNASFHFSEESGSFKEPKQKMKESSRLSQFSNFKIQGLSRYQKPNETRRQHLPPIGKLNKSLDTIPQGIITKPSMKMDANGKKGIINRLELLQSIQKDNQIRLMNKLETIESTPRVKSQRKRKNVELEGTTIPFSTLQEESFRIRPKKKLDFADKIKQLQSRLKRSKR